MCDRVVVDACQAAMLNGDFCQTIMALGLRVNERLISRLRLPVLEFQGDISEEIWAGPVAIEQTTVPTLSEFMMPRLSVRETMWNSNLICSVSLQLTGTCTSGGIPFRGRSHCFLLHGILVPQQQCRWRNEIKFPSCRI